MGDGMMTWITDGVTQNLSNGFSWCMSNLGVNSAVGSWFGSAASGIATGIGLGATLWSAATGVKMVIEGFNAKPKKHTGKILVGTVTVLLAGVEFLPESWRASLYSVVGGCFVAPYLAKAVRDFSQKNQAAAGFLASVASLKFGIGLKLLAGDGPGLNDEGVTGLFAVLTLVGNAYGQDPTNWKGHVLAGLPHLEKCLPGWALIRDRKDILDFVFTNAQSVMGYLSSLSASVLRASGVQPAQACGTQVVIAAPKTRKK